MYKVRVYLAIRGSLNGAATRRSRHANIADAVASAVGRFADWVTARAVNNGLRRLETKIRRTMPRGSGGVLIYVQIHRAGRDSRLKILGIVDSGYDPRVLIERDQARGKISHIPVNKAWKASEYYIWISRGGKPWREDDSSCVVLPPHVHQNPY